MITAKSNGLKVKDRQEIQFQGSPIKYGQGKPFLIFFSNGLKSPNCAKKGFGPGTLQFLLCYNRGLTPVLQTDVTVNVQQTC